MVVNILFQDINFTYPSDTGNTLYEELKALTLCILARKHLYENVRVIHKKMLQVIKKSRNFEANRFVLYRKHVLWYC